MNTINQIAQNIMSDILVPLAGGLVVIGWVIAGILYVTAKDDPGKIETAKKALIACVIGTFLVILAQTGNSVIDMISKSIGIT